jgi:hypothetical protein
MFNLFSKSKNNNIFFSGIELDIDAFVNQLFQMCIDRSKNKIDLLEDIFQTKGGYIIPESAFPLIFEKNIGNEIGIVWNHLEAHLKNEKRDTIKNLFERLIQHFCSNSSNLNINWELFKEQYLTGEYSAFNDFYVNQCLELCNLNYQQFPVFSQREISAHFDQIDNDFKKYLVNANIN